MQLKKENVPFTMVANEVLKDPNLSFRAKGLYSYLFSKPDTWNFSSNRMTIETKDGRKAIMSTLRELEERGYLKRTRLVTGKMEYTLKYRLSPEKELGLLKPKSPLGTVPNRHSAVSSPISNTDNTSNTEEKVIHTSDGVPSHDIQLFINSFKDINPSYKRLFANKTERDCSSRLIKAYGIDKMLATVQELSKIIGMPYAPRITTPYELEKNLGKLIAFYKQEKNKIISNKPIVHI